MKVVAMTHYNWISMSDEEEASLLDKVNDATVSKIFKQGRSNFAFAELPFYKNFKLLRVTAYTTIPPVSMRFLLGGSAPDWKIVKMNGTNEPIFEHNAEAGLVLNKDTVVDYVTFVMGEVHSEEGSLRVVEEVDDDTFSSTPTPEERRTVTHLIRKAKVEENADGFTVDATMLYGDSVYWAKIAVKKDGMIEIVEDDKKAENMPIRPIYLE